VAKISEYHFRSCNLHDFTFTQQMRYASFRRHMEEVKQSHFFKPWTTGSRDAVGNAITPIELLVLGVLTGSLQVLINLTSSLYPNCV